MSNGPKTIPAVINDPRQSPDIFKCTLLIANEDMGSGWAFTDEALERMAVQWGNKIEDIGGEWRGPIFMDISGHQYPVGIANRLYKDGKRLIVEFGSFMFRPKQGKKFDIDDFCLICKVKTKKKKTFAHTSDQFIEDAELVEICFAPAHQATPGCGKIEPSA